MCNSVDLLCVMMMMKQEEGDLSRAIVGCVDTGRHCASQLFGAQNRLPLPEFPPSVRACSGPGSVVATLSS